MIVNFNSYVENVIAEIYNSVGKRKKYATIEKTDKYVFDISNLKTGIYLLRLNFGDKIITKEIIVN